MTPALVVVAHGSRDARSAATVRHLVAELRGRAAGVDVREAFLDLSTPRVDDTLAALHRDGHRHVVAVPLLLGSAYHARVDLPALVAEVTTRLPRLRVTVADVLGTDPRLQRVALDRVANAGVDLTDPELGLVLAAVGSSHGPANDVVCALARDWHDRLGIPTVAAFATATRPDVSSALAALRARGARRFAVASWFLAPGLLLDRVADRAREAEPDVAVAAPLGADPRVARVVLHRYAEALVRAATATRRTA
ncbi:sirohydrochlorin chelatase [Saccharomonospora sp. NB11]|uniref:sirohydrochlorin chelatase n=1 Tax=Saccharomonospora sp. NB11 TaxID=1642298 RepID=UPI0018D09743|nr:sirohydrochlorin chelatase [Saccharomonospora sp. NB11]